MKDGVEQTASKDLSNQTKLVMTTSQKQQSYRNGQTQQQ